MKSKEQGSSGSESEEEKDNVGQLGALPPPPPQAAKGAQASKFSALQLFPDYFQKTDWVNEFFPVYSSGTDGIVFFCVHGAGHSGASFAILAKLLREKGHSLVTFDQRGHGNNKLNECEYDQTLSNLVQDAQFVLQYAMENLYQQNIFIIVGHSMGGSVATRLASQYQHARIKGAVQVDVVEGSALDALPHMETIVSSRPAKFQSVEHAIQWAVRSSTIKNLESARLSIQTQVVQADPKTFV